MFNIRQKLSDDDTKLYDAISAVAGHADMMRTALTRKHRKIADEEFEKVKLSVKRLNKLMFVPNQASMRELQTLLMQCGLNEMDTAVRYSEDHTQVEIKGNFDSTMLSKRLVW